MKRLILLLLIISFVLDFYNHTMAQNDKSNLSFLNPKKTLTTKTEGEWLPATISAYENDGVIYKKAFTYNEDGYLVSEWNQKYIYNGWQTDAGRFYSYDERNNRLLCEYMEYKRNGMQAYSKEAYTYDDRNNLLSETIYSRDGSNWVENLKRTYTYDAKNNLLIKNFETSGGRIIYVYDDNGNCIEMHDQHWSNQKNIWEEDTSRIHYYFYDENSRLHIKIEPRQSSYRPDHWGDWCEEEDQESRKYHSRKTYFYDTQNNLIEELEEIDINGMYENFARNIFTFDENNNLLSRSYQQAENNEWTEAYREVYTYDNKNNLLTETFTATKHIYSYDDQNNKISVVSQTKTDEEWVNTSKQTYFYDENSNATSTFYWKWNNNSWEKDINYYLKIPVLKGEEEFSSVDIFPGATHKLTVTYIKKGDTTDNSYFTDSSEFRIFIDDLSAETPKTSISNEITIFPNPAKDFVNIQSAIGIQSLTVFNQMGQKVREESVNCQKLDISNLSNGIYFLQMKTSERIVTKKLIKR